MSIEMEGVAEGQGCVQVNHGPKTEEQGVSRPQRLVYPDQDAVNRDDPIVRYLKDIPMEAKARGEAALALFEKIKGVGR